MNTKEPKHNEDSMLADEDTDLVTSQKAFEELEKLKRKFSPPITDDKEEYIRYLESKYSP